ncbi:LytR C-terminal domain-containing protein [Actinomadura luteofluorescens]|uniref:LytR C-terminal domain-containing protein n=1 Tax=Actinomadura luteofluorescens TaxID=46163 RepID=UPI00364490D4
MFNASGVEGRAAQVAAQLKDAGWQVAAVGNLGSRPRATVVRYGTGAEPQARALAGLLPGARVAPRAKTPPGVVDLVIGTGFTRVRTSGGVPVQRGESRASDEVCERVA